MRRSLLPALALTLLALAACRREAPPRDSLTQGQHEPESPPLDSRGQPLLEASDVVVYGVVLPVRHRHAYDVGGVPVYKTPYEARQVIDFFADRYGRASLEAIGEGGVFRAVPVTVDGAARRVDISVLGRSTGGARVQVHLLPDVAVRTPGDPAERLRAYAEHVRTLD
jgi:hypothetical protein